MPQVGLAVAAVAGSVAAAAPAIGTFLTTNFVGRILASVAVSALLSVLQPGAGASDPGGFRTSVTQTGGDNPASIILGRAATAGTHVCPPMSHSNFGDNIPNLYLTYVINLCDMPGATLEQVMLNGEYVTLGPTPHADYGLPVQGDYTGYAWVKYLDGSQTSADPMLMAKYGSYPERPWQSDMIGRGMGIAIWTFKFNSELWSGFPQTDHVLGSIPMYDPRKDTTVGGSGAHRWANKATWETTRNPYVQIYNIMRGISEPGGSTWGGRIAAADLPLSSWFAAMNVCDAPVALQAGGTEPQYEAGLEVRFSDKPADVIKLLLDACSGQLADVGGTWLALAGPPAGSVYFFTDKDIVTTKGQTLTPFPNAGATYNGAHASYPEPKSLWKSKDAPPLYDAAYEAADRLGRRVASLTFPAVSNVRQVRRLMKSNLKDDRRFIRHGFVLPPDAAVLSPIVQASWTSAINGYGSKAFFVSQVEDELATALQTVTFRERDPTDYDWNPADELPLPAAATPAVKPAAQAVPGWAVTGVPIKDAAGTDRRPAIRLAFSGDLPDVTGVNYEVRVQATGVVIAQGTIPNFSPFRADITSGILAGETYEARGRLVTGRSTTWTGWDAATAPNLPTDTVDIKPGAVIVDGAVFYSNQVTLTSFVTYQLLAEYRVTRTSGFATLLDFSGKFSGFGNAVLQLGLFRSGVLLREQMQVLGDEGRPHLVTWKTIDTNTAAGVTTYSIRGRKVDSNGYANNIKVGPRLIDLVQRKR